jgi:hypothetical protein
MPTFATILQPTAAILFALCPSAALKRFIFFSKMDFQNAETPVFRHFSQNPPPEPAMPQSPYFTGHSCSNSASLDHLFSRHLKMPVEICKQACKRPLLYSLIFKMTLHF